jgi:hypothetical protein
MGMRDPNVTDHLADSVLNRPLGSHFPPVDVIGTTHARVSFVMNTFRNLCFISYKGRIEIYALLPMSLCITMRISTPIRSYLPM